MQYITAWENYFIRTENELRVAWRNADLGNRLQAALQTVEEKVRAIPPTIAKVTLMASKFFSQLILFHLFPNLTIYGFAVGFVFSDQMSQVRTKVNTVYDSCRNRLETLALAGGGVFTVYFMPASLVLANLYLSASWGCDIYESSRRRLDQYTQSVAPVEPAPVAPVAPVNLG